MSPSQFGLVFGIFTLAYGLFEMPGGWMGDRFGLRRVADAHRRLVVGLYRLDRLGDAASRNC